jgi:hypothetical protein
MFLFHSSRCLTIEQEGESPVPRIKNPVEIRMQSQQNKICANVDSTELERRDDAGKITKILLFDNFRHELKPRAHSRRPTAVLLEEKTGPRLVKKLTAAQENCQLAFWAENRHVSTDNERDPILCRVRKRYPMNGWGRKKKFGVLLGVEFSIVMAQPFRDFIHDGNGQEPFFHEEQANAGLQYALPSQNHAEIIRCQIAAAQGDFTKLFPPSAMLQNLSDLIFIKEFPPQGDMADQRPSDLLPENGVDQLPVRNISGIICKLTKQNRPSRQRSHEKMLLNPVR